MARRNGSTENWGVIVTGPGLEGKPFPNIGSALAFAMHEAGNAPADCEDCTWYVRDGERVLHVEREGRNVVYRERVPVKT